MAKIIIADERGNTVDFEPSIKKLTRNNFSDEKDAILAKLEREMVPLADGCGIKGAALLDSSQSPTELLVNASLLCALIRAGTIVRFIYMAESPEEQEEFPALQAIFAKSGLALKMQVLDDQLVGTVPAREAPATARKPRVVPKPRVQPTALGTD